MLTKKEKQTFDFIKDYIEQHSIAPTLPEIAQGIGFTSKGATSKYVSALVDSGHLMRKKSKGSSRNICVHKQWQDEGLSRIRAHIPLVGRIAAGQPIEAVAENETCDLNDIIRGDNLFMLQVTGQSMIDEGIFDGDYIICERASNARDGEIVVALIDNQEATLKKIYLQGRKVLLCPANSSMAPMEFNADDVTVQGKLKYKLRSY